MPTENRIGPYRVQRKLHEGGQGSVVLAYDKRLLRQGHNLKMSLSLEPPTY